MENGSIGEARTRAFLIDKFWILERSVDVEGADFVIQRRMEGRGLLDRSPPRFGVVQAKFLQDAATTHYVHREYVVDEDERPRPDFFVVAHTGRGSGARVFLLSGEDIATQCRLTDSEHSKADRYVVSGRDLLVARKFEVVDSRDALARMDATIARADFLGNRHFLSWALPSMRDGAGIDPAYLEPLDNWYGDISKGFHDLKKNARSAWFAIEEVADKLRIILESTDPAEALSAAEDLHHDYRGSVTYERLGSQLYDEDLHTVVRRHKEAVDVLRRCGRLDEFLAFKRRVQEAMADALCTSPPPPPNVVCEIEIDFDLDDLRRACIGVSLRTAVTDESPYRGSSDVRIQESWKRAVGRWVPYLGPDKTWDGKKLVEHPVTDLRGMLIERASGWASELVFEMVARLT